MLNSNRGEHLVRVGGQIPDTYSTTLSVQIAGFLFHRKNAGTLGMVLLAYHLTGPSIFLMIVEASTLQIVLPLPWDILVEAFA